MEREHQLKMRHHRQEKRNITISGNNVKLHNHTSATYWWAVSRIHSIMAASGIEKTCQIHNLQCLHDKHKLIVQENSNCCSHGGQTGIVPRSPPKETLCDIMNSIPYHGLMEGTE